MNGNTEFTSSIAPVISRYLELKIALGRRYATEQNVLRALDVYLVTHKADELTAVVFEQWCQTRVHLKSGIRRAEMRIVRNLCLYRRRSEPHCFVPDPNLFPPCHQPLRPYCLSPEEMARLIAAADTLFMSSGWPLRAAAVRLGLVLLYTAGLRRGELLRLTIGDYDGAARTVLIRESKFHKSRLLPLSIDAARELEVYLSARRAYRPQSMTDEAPLIWYGGKVVRSYTGSGFGRLYRRLAQTAGIHRADGQPPRVHDVRHSFAINALLRWYRAGLDVQAKLPLLSTYLGHISIASTQHYLHFVEPLASEASERFAQYCGSLITPTPEEGPPDDPRPTQCPGTDPAPVLRRPSASPAGVERSHDSQLP